MQDCGMKSGSGAAGSGTDAESGREWAAQDAAADRAQSLRALEAMHKRGLIGDSDYEARRRELLAGG